QRDPGNLAARVTDGDKCCAPAELTQRLFGVPAADRIDHRIEGPGAEGISQLVTEPARPVVDQYAGALGAGCLEFGRRRRRRDHGRTERGGEFDGGESDTATRSENQHRVTGRDPRYRT